MSRLLALVTFVALAGCGGSSGSPVGQRVPPYALEGGEVTDIPAPLDSSAFNYLVVGDWGRNGFFNQSDVARAMGVIGADIASRFTISTGDNFYTQGVRSTEDPKWVRSFEAIYTAPALQSRWYSTLGNHDWQGSVPAQIQYTNQSDRWYLPAQYYAETLTLDDGTEVLFAFIDTTPLASTPEKRSRFSDSGSWDVEPQLEWLEGVLEGSDAPWKIVVGHHPIYVGSVRYTDNPLMIERLVPMLEEHGVQAYFAGHDHNLQHHRPEDSVVDYFVSGAGSLTREVLETPNTLFALRTPGFMAVSMTATSMEVQGFTGEAQLVYRAVVPLQRGSRLDLPFGLGD